MVMQTVYQDQLMNNSIQSKKKPEEEKDGIAYINMIHVHGVELNPEKLKDSDSFMVFREVGKQTP